MNPLIFAVLCITLVLAQDAFPQSTWYHTGSYASVLLAAGALQWWAVRRHRSHLLAVCAATIVAVAGLASALFAPDTQRIIAGPGQTIDLSEPRAALQFPVAQPPGAPVLHRQRKDDLTLDPGGKHAYLANYILWTEPRIAAYVEAFDSRGGHLTITQPQAANAPFLSPVLLFLQTKDFKDTQGAAPASLPVDAFALPAAHRSVNAVLFSADAIAKMQRLSTDPRPGILFAVSDDRGVPLRGALGLARSGQTVALGGVRLRPLVENFPTVVIASSPYLPVVCIGLVLFGANFFKDHLKNALKSRFRWRT